MFHIIPSCERSLPPPRHCLHPSAVAPNSTYHEIMIFLSLQLYGAFFTYFRSDRFIDTVLSLASYRWSAATPAAAVTTATSVEAVTAAAAAAITLVGRAAAAPE